MKNKKNSDKKDNNVKLPALTIEQMMYLVKKQDEDHTLCELCEKDHKFMNYSLCLKCIKGDLDID